MDDAGMTLSSSCVFPILAVATRKAQSYGRQFEGQYNKMVGSVKEIQVI